MRSFPSYRGQSAFAGWWWLATTGEHVGHESWLERDNLIALDFDPDVVGVVSQPFWLHWTDDVRARRHAPDYFVRMRDGAGLVVDVRADDRIEPEDAAAFAATERACDQVGWGYRRVGVLDPVLAANLRWLAGYRHPRCLRPGLVAEVERVFDGRIELGCGVAAVGDPIVVLPTVFHLLWSGRLAADLTGAVLGMSTVVGVG
ncbi:TnsA-like heteromeric transposase endonuclease subunit [Nocardia sp. NPDC052278]|uniref:TnsA-like heteromeric transposase endonuclease subunit n=1 Tax=Nocardia sp. NPDC052278 TaxID=3364328 RepID=UPI0037C7913A